MSNYKRTENHKNDKLSGIYCITNIINGKKYVGQTYNLKYRWMRHKSDLRNNNHSNNHLQAAWKKYGEKSFKYEILEYCTLDDIDEREKYWIDYYDCFKNGYNQAEGGLGCRGYKHTEEEIAKMRMIQNPEPILQIDFDGNIINEFVSAGEAKNILGFKSASGIKSCCKKDGYYKSSNGFIWIYKKDINDFKLEDHLTNFKSRSQKVSQYTIDNKFIREWNSAYEAGKELNIMQSEIQNVCDGKSFTYKGSIWKYDGNPAFSEDIYNNIKNKNTTKPIMVDKYNMEGTYIETFKTLSDAAKNVGASSGDISNCCKGKRQSTRGFRFAYNGEKLKDLKQKNVKHLMKEVLQYSIDGELLNSFESITEASKHMGVLVSSVSKAIINNTKCKGFKWKFSEELDENSSSFSME